MTHSVSQQSHGTSNLVISCIDYRFRPAVAQWIKKEFNDSADLLADAGAAKSLLDTASCDYILDQIKIGIALHGVTTVHILNHIDCGAYGGSSKHADVTSEHTFHAAEGAKAVAVIREAFPDLTVKTYLVTFEGVQAFPVQEVSYANAG